MCEWEDRGILRNLGDWLRRSPRGQYNIIGSGYHPIARFPEHCATILCTEKCAPTLLQSLIIRSNRPSPLAFNARMLPRHKIGQERPVEVIALARRAEGGLPAGRAVLPLHGSEIGDGGERRGLTRHGPDPLFRLDFAECMVDDAQEQVERGDHFSPRSGIGQHQERAGEEVVLRGGPKSCG